MEDKHLRKFKDWCQTRTPDELVEEYNSRLLTLSRQCGHAAGLQWAIDSTPEARRSFAEAVQESSPTNPEKGDAVDYVRSWSRRGFDSFLAMLKVDTGFDPLPDPTDYQSAPDPKAEFTEALNEETELWSDEGWCIGWVDGVMASMGLNLG